MCRTGQTVFRFIVRRIIPANKWNRRGTIEKPIIFITNMNLINHKYVDDSRLVRFQ